MSIHRAPAGTPQGGQFTPTERPEASNVIVMPLPLESVVPAVGEHLALDVPSTGHPFESVTVTRVAALDSFRVTGTKTVDLRAQAMDYYSMSPQEADRFLDDNEDVIAAHLWDRYDAAASGPEWTETFLSTSVDLPCDARIDEAWPSLESATGTDRLNHLRDDDLIHGIARAIHHRDCLIEEHEVGAHDDMHLSECPDCEADEARLNELADQIRKQERA